MDHIDGLVTLGGSSIYYIEPANLTRYQDVYIKSESGATFGFNRSHLSALSSICHDIFMDLYQCPLANSDEAIHISTNLTKRELEMLSDFFLHGSLPTLAEDYGVNFKTKALFEAFGLRLQNLQCVKQEHGLQSFNDEPISLLTDFDPEDDDFIPSKKARDSIQHKEESDMWDESPTPSPVPKKQPKAKRARRHVNESSEDLFSFPQTGQRDFSLAFQCQRCVRGFNRVMDYRQHYYRHEMGKEDLSKAFVCLKCMNFTAASIGLVGKNSAHWCKECPVKRFDDMNSKITYFCAFCEVVFTSSMLLEKHLEEKHATERKKFSRPQFECSACGKGFTCNKTLMRHIKREGPFHKCHCVQCNMDFDSWTDLSMHNSKVHDNKVQYMCGICGVNYFDSEKQRQDHKNFCKLQAAVGKVRPCGEGQVVCTICGLEVEVSHQKVRSHLNEYHSNLGIKCEMCSQLFFSDNNLNIHMLAVHVNASRYSCDVCEKAFPSQPRLKLHREVSHPLTGGVKHEHKCDICQATYTMKSSLTKHYLDKHSDAPKIKKTRVCEVCGETVLEAYYKTHMDTWHTTGHIPCEVCGKMWASEQILKRHMRQTHRKVNITCEQCGLEFTNKAGYRRHLRSKHGPEDKKSYYCSPCGKGFMSNQAYDTHMNGHAGTKPHKCKFCDRCFADINNCRKHMKQAHPGCNDKVSKEKKS